MANEQQDTAVSLADFSIQAGGSSLPVEVRGSVTRLEVRDSIDRAGTFAIELNNWDDSKDKVLHSDDTLWDPGATVSIEMGYQESVTKVMDGEVTGLQVSFREGRPGAFVVRGHDRLNRLRRGRRTKSYLQAKDSDVASQIAGELGLTADVESTSEVHPYLLQTNQTDIDFLKTRARAIGYELLADAKTLTFRKSKHDRGAANKFDFKHGLIAFEAYLSTLDQISKVTVRGWDPKAKAALVGQAAAGAVTGTMGGKKTGPSAVGPFGDKGLTLVEHPVATQGEADLLAQGMLDHIALGYVHAELTAIGTPAVKAGDTVEIGSVGDRFSGQYQVTEVEHVWESRFVTRAHLRRNAS